MSAVPAIPSLDQEPAPRRPDAPQSPETLADVGLAPDAVRDLLLKLPKGSGVLLCGRDHYFDDEREMQHGLGLSGRTFALVRLGEFTEEQALRSLHWRRGNHRKGSLRAHRESV